MFSIIELRYLQGNRWMHKVVIGIIYSRPLSTEKKKCYTEMLHVWNKRRKRKQYVGNERKTLENHE